MAHLESLVVLDPNTRSRDALAFGFRRDGYEVFAVADGVEAMAAARENGAQLLVVATPDASASDAATGTSALLAVIGRVRSETATRDLPMVVVGDRLGREEALRAGADEYVARPAFLRDVITLSKLAVALRQGGDPAGIAGALDDFGLYFLTRAMAVAGRSAVVTLLRGARRGELAFAQGELVSARVGGLRGEPAYQHLLTWNAAELQLALQSPAGERKLNMPLELLLSQGAHFVEKFETEAAALGGSEATYGQVARRVAAVKAELPPTVFTLLKLCDGRRALVDLVEDGPFKPFDALGVVGRLLELGAIDRLDGDEERPTVARVPLAEQLAVRDWLLGTKAEESRNTVTEAGRRAAEAYAEEEARRANEKSPGDDLFESPAEVAVPAAAPTAAGAAPSSSPASSSSGQQQGGGSKKKKKGKQARAAARQEAAKAKSNGTPANGTHVKPISAPVENVTNGAHSNGVAKVDAKPESKVDAKPDRKVDAKVDSQPEAKSDQASGKKPDQKNGEQPAAKLSASALADAPAKEKLFDEMEEAFFARPAEATETIDTFDDLAPAPKPKRRWSLFSLVGLKKK